jgi:hypothetical protein
LNQCAIQQKVEVGAVVVAVLALAQLDLQEVDRILSSEFLF